MDATVIANKIPNVQGGFSTVYTLDTIVGGKAVSAMEVTRALYRDR